MVVTTYSCSTDSNNPNEALIEDIVGNQNGNDIGIPVTIDANLNQADIDALLFMLEEEKLARDTYIFLYDVWNQNIFSNISNSEQSHINAVKTLLDANQVNYTILQEGKFENQDLQNLYDKFIKDGVASINAAFIIGATIEDLDIADLDTFISNATSPSLVEVFESLQCGSRNHLRSFNAQLLNYNASYNPQFITQDEFSSIISSSNEKCN